MSAQHMPGRVCDTCEGFSLQPAGKRLDAGVDMSFRLGQRLRHQDYKGQRVTGVVRSLSIEHEQGLMVTIGLDAPIVIPEGQGYSAINIYSQHAPAHEFAPFDDRDELIAELVALTQRCEQRLAAAKWRTDGPRASLPPEAVLLLDLRDAIAKATGSAV